MMRRKQLRSGYTTGACAAAAARAAAELLLKDDRSRTVEITLPAGERVTFELHSKRTEGDGVWASVIKDAGDDPDVTNHAEIAAIVRYADRKKDLRVIGGRGVGRVTRPGLSVKPGNPAINPVPLKMIRAEVRDVMKATNTTRMLDIEIVVPRGEELARYTLNSRLGIVGGISILGTTGIVRPLSAHAWTATISSTLSVAQATGQEQVVLSSGRTSEKAYMQISDLPEACFAMMGDFVYFSLSEAGKFEFKKIHLVAQWAKMLKIAMGTPDTHVRAGAFHTGQALLFLTALGIDIPRRQYNTAREMFEALEDSRMALRVAEKAREYAEYVSGRKVEVHLVGYDGTVISTSA